MDKVSNVNEWLEAQWNRLRRKVDQLVIVALAILLGVTAFLWWLEQQAPQPTKPQLQQVVIPTPSVLWDDFRKNLFTHPKDLRQVPELRGLLDFNMFDARSALVQSETIARLDKQFEKANEAFQKNDLATAKRICQDIIKEMPSHRRAIELQKVISEIERKQEAKPEK